MNKTIVQACEALFPNATHRFCVKHLHSNWSSAGFKGTTLRNALWAAAKASTPAQFVTKMNDIVEIDLEAGKWLDEKPACEWSRSHFQTSTKCDMLVNNICESFNSKFFEARELTIIHLMEGVRHYVMSRMQENRDRARQRWMKNKVCPKIMKRLNINIDKATTCIPYKADDTHFEISCPFGETYIVDIEERTCSCRKWDLTGLFESFNRIVYHLRYH